MCCHTQSGNGKGVHVLVEAIISFLVAVAAGVACHYIIKWLDSEEESDD